MGFEILLQLICQLMSYQKLQVLQPSCGRISPFYFFFFSFLASLFSKAEQSVWTATEVKRGLFSFLSPKPQTYLAAKRDFASEPLSTSTESVA